MQALRLNYDSSRMLLFGHYVHKFGLICTRCHYITLLCYILCYWDIWLYLPFYYPFGHIYPNKLSHEAVVKLLYSCCLSVCLYVCLSVMTLIKWLNIVNYQYCNTTSHILWSCFEFRFGLLEFNVSLSQ